jgi:hypothetical protein
MKSAKELYEISKEQAPLLVKSVLGGVKEHCITRCEEEANTGSTTYAIYLNKTREFAKELLLEKCIELVKDFEDNGYKVSIDDSGNGYYIEFIITFSWDGLIYKKHDKYFGEYEHLYDTENGIVDSDTK